VIRRNGAIAVDAQTGAAGSHGVYAGGDVVHGPATVIQACADGRRAAKAICAQLGVRFEPLPSYPATLSAGEIEQVKRVRAQKEAQCQAEMLPVTQRGGFDLVEPTLAQDAARREAARCMQCSTLCDKCVEVCPNRANYTYFVAPLQVLLPQLICQKGRLAMVGEQPFEVQQTRQIIHVDDFCNECGNCATFCVHQGKPHSDKPRLFLHQSDFQAQSDNAFHITRTGQGWVLRRRQGGQEALLSLPGGTAQMEFENDWVRLTLRPVDLSIKSMALKREFAGELSLATAAEMYVLLQGVSTSLPFLPLETS
jgi:putative selenate reductase